MENRSFDEYFGTFPGAIGFYDPNGAAIFPQANFPGNAPPLLPFRASTFSSSGEEIAGCNHSWAAQQQAFAGGQMNGWGVAQGGNAATMAYYAGNDIPYHWRLAQTFLLCDTFYCSVLGPTYPNRIFLMAGTVFPSMPSNAGSTIPFQSNTLLPVIDNPPYFGDPLGSNPWQSGITSYPAMIGLHNSQPGAAQVSWTLYDDQNWGPVGSAAPGPLWLEWSPPNATSASLVNPPAYLAFMGQPNTPQAQWPQVWNLNVLCFLKDQNGVGNGIGTGTVSPDIHYSATPGGAARSNFEIDALAGNLPNVSWIVPPSYVTEHPAFLPCDAESYLARVVNAVVNGKHWENTVLVITYDENDGHFDHVAPPVPHGPGQIEPWVSGGSGWAAASPVGAGFRIPTIIVSPWTVGAGLSSQVAPGKSFDNTSILQYLEEITQVTCSNLPALNSANNFRRSTFSSLGVLIKSNNAPTPAANINLPSLDQVDAWRIDALNRLFGATPVLTAKPAFVLPAPNPVPTQAWPPLQQQCYLITDKTTFGLDEVQAQLALQMSMGDTSPATFDNAFWVVVDGFEPAELNIPSQTPLPQAPAYATPIVPQAVLTIASSGNLPNGVSVVVGAAQPLDPGLPPVPQRFCFPCQIVFNDINAAFAGVTANTPLLIALNATFTSRLTWNAPAEQIELVASADPFIQNGAVSYLCPDLRVYMVPAGGQLFGAALPANIQPNDSAAAITFIQAVIANLNQPGSTLGAPFDTPPANPADPSLSTVTLYPSYNGPVGPAVYNFAVVRVCLQGLADTANNVRVFFRLCPAAATGTAFDPSTLYRSTPVSGDASDYSGAPGDPVTTPNPNNTQDDPGETWPTRVPLLGLLGGDYVTFPFFATPRVTPNKPMWMQPPDWPNTQQITPNPSGAIRYAYFGCWLDINQSAAQFPTSPPSTGSADGPFTAALPISASSIRNQHQCLVAEVSFDPIPIPLGATPGDSDKLAQRNLVVNGGTNN
jgi:phospholipase C